MNGPLTTMPGLDRRWRVAHPADRDVCGVSAETACARFHKALPRKRRGGGPQPPVTQRSSSGPDPAQRHKTDIAMRDAAGSPHLRRRPEHADRHGYRSDEAGDGPARHGWRARSWSSTSVRKFSLRRSGPAALPLAGETIRSWPPAPGWPADNRAGWPACSSRGHPHGPGRRRVPGRAVAGRHR